MLRAYLFLALLEPKTPPKQRKILSRNKYTVIGIPITVNLFLDSTAAISQNQSRKEVGRSAQKQIYSNRAPDYCLFVSGRKILSRNKYTVIGIPITVYLFLDRILRPETNRQ